MYVPDHSIGLAVLRVFRDLRVFHAGGTLYVDTVRSAWPSTGLRRRDMEHGIAWLVNRGLLEPGSKGAPGDPSLISLTPLGSAQMLHFPSSLGEWVVLLEGVSTLAAIRRRRRRQRVWDQLRRRFWTRRPDSPLTVNA
jgi:hypothetical protein